jgi:CRP-like cAMP-binding protein
MRHQTFQGFSSPSEIQGRVAELRPTLLDGFGSRELEVVVTSGTLRRIRAHAIICKEGHRADTLYLLLDGQARNFTLTPTGTKVVVFWAHPGAILGGGTLVANEMDYLMSAEAVTDVVALMWKRNTIKALENRYPTLADNALQVSCDYLAQYRTIHLAAGYSTANKRIADLLNVLGTEMGKPVPGGGVEVKIRNEDLANEANVTVFTVSRLMSDWQRGGLIIKGRGKITIPSMKALLRNANRNQISH